MSGVEVAGLVLGALPLMLYALDNYHRCLKPLQRFAKYQTCIQTLQNGLQISCDRFKYEVRILLVAAAGLEKTESLLGSSDTQLGLSEEVDALVQTYLADLYDEVDNVAMEIKARSEDLLEAIGDLSASASADAQTAKGSQRPSKQRVALHLKARLKVCRKQGSLEDALQALDRDLDKLESYLQRRRRLDEAEECHARSSMRRAPTVEQMEAYFVKKESARTLFEAVQKIRCTKHTAHSVMFGLDPELFDIKAAQIWFKVRYGGPAPASSSPLPPSCEQRRFQLLVESCVTSASAGDAQDESVGDPAQATQSSSSRKRLMSAVPAVARATTGRQQQSKRVRFIEDGFDAQTFLAASDLQLPDFLQKDFCNVLRKLQEQTLRSGCCIGCFPRNRRHQLRFHLEQPAPQRRGPDVVSLQAFLNRLRKTRLGCLSDEERYRLARRLASAVLSFHDTPWLASSLWTSSEVFLDATSSDEDTFTSQLSEPFVDVALNDSLSVLQGPGSTTHPYITNPLVFGLGLMLLELAFEEPVQSLCTARERASARLDAAWKMTTGRMKMVAGKTCGKYHVVVERCLRDFAVKDSLETCPKLRQQFHRDVVIPLKELEERFLELNVED